MQVIHYLPGFHQSFHYWVKGVQRIYPFRVVRLVAQVILYGLACLQLTKFGITQVGQKDLCV